jgi:hypothetical protein
MSRGGGDRLSGMLDSVPTMEQPPNSRSVYLPIIRDRIDPTLDVFDFPDASLVSGRRDATIVASQSLFFMNDPFVQQAADALASKLLQRKSLKQQIEHAYLLTLARRPTENEHRLLARYLSDRKDIAERWSEVFQSLIASAEFRFSP